MISQSWLAKLSAPLTTEIESFNVRAVQLLSTLYKYSEVEIEELTRDLWSEYTKLQDVTSATVSDEKAAEDEKMGA